MLELHIPEVEWFDESKQEFVYTKDVTLKLEHSLIALSKWEAKWKTPFLGTPKTDEQTLDYIRAMTINPNVDPNVYLAISDAQQQEISDYISDEMTATTFLDLGGPPKQQVVTAEVIYYWMISLQVPFECQKWHLNQLLTLLRVCSEKNAPAKKMSKAEVISRNKQLNAARRQAMNSSG